MVSPQHGLGSNANAPLRLLACRPGVLAAGIFSVARGPESCIVWVVDWASLTVTEVMYESHFVFPRAMDDIDLTARLRLIYCNC